MNSEQMRAEFEEWSTKHHGIYAVGCVDGHYSSQSVANDWFVWQASRAALVVDLPDPVHFSGCLYMEESEIFESLDRAGVNYK